MGYLIKELKIIGNKGEAILKCLFDTGAGYSFIRKDIAEKLGDIIKFPKKMEFKLGDGESKIIINEKIILEIEINGVTISDEVLVSDKLSEDMIIGAKTMQAWRIKLDMENEKILIDPKVAELKLV
jgi:predicted aspartyl protease